MFQKTFSLVLRLEMLIVWISHQKEALEFMLQREQGPIPEAYQLWKPYDIEGQPWYVLTGSRV